MQAYETQLEFSGARGHAVVVEFDKPWRFVFWDKAQYIGCVDLGKGVWFTPEWCETNSPNDLHCYEPIMDKQLRWSRIQILESGPARVRVKWSYAMNDMRYRIFHGDSRADEIYTIYPDGIAVREVVLWPGTQSNHGGNANFWQQAEWILVNGAGSNPLDVLRQPAPFTMCNGCGESFDIPWPLPPDWFSPLCQYYPQISDFPMFVGKVNLRGVPNPFFAAFNDQVLYPHMPCAHCGKDHPYMTLFPGKELINVYKHWPVTDMEDFLEWVPAGEDMGKVATHTSFISVNFASRRSPKDYIPTPDPGASWYFLVGATAESTDGSELEALARSYYYPAQIEVTREPGEPPERHRGRVLLEGYDWSLRAQTFRKQGEDRVEFAMDPHSEEMAMGTKTGHSASNVVAQINPVFVINGWTAPGARVFVDGQELPARRYATQVHDHDLTVWVEGRFEQETQFKIVT
jgi:hypothetical protein